MRVLLLLYCIIFISQTISVLKSDQCSDCSGFSNKDDCKNANCIWDMNDVCQNNGTDSSVDNSNENLNYCQRVTIPQQNCFKTRGCAYYNESCTFFAGCSSYNYNATVDCQIISSLCISEGDGCIDIKNCASYKTEEICKATPSNSGSGTCMWDITNLKCRDQYCSEASNALNTDQECSNFMQGCVTTGRGCSNYPLKSCNTYSNTGIDCEQLIGSDGQCENNEGYQFCQLKQCITAPITYKKDEQCNSYLAGCITTGRGCTKQLQPCKTYIDMCNEYIGSDGICEYENSSTKCRSRICENGEYQTNEDCNQYKTGCLTNGLKCVSSLIPCSSYKGTMKSCLGLIGSDGQCKGIDQTEQPCQVKDCIQDSNNKQSTDDQCQQIQKVCVTNGYGCAYSLKLCSQYQTESSICNQMIGSDGKCQGSQQNIGYCERRKCSDAPITYSTDYECKSFQNNCVSTGKGCIDQNTCENTATEISCLGTDGCLWNQFCIDSSNCSNFTTQLLCQNNNAIQYQNNNGIIQFIQIKCIWKSNSCNNLNCSDLIDSKYDSDYACQQVQSNCVYGGNGCIDKTSDCSKFIGNQQMCSLYANKCWNDSNSQTTSNCRSRVCSDNITFQTDEECAYFQKGCRTKGQGCIEETKVCSDYYGTQQQCNKFSGYITNSTDRQQCYNVANATSSVSCIVKTCAMATGLLNDSDCQKFLKGCLWNGKTSCLSDTSDCTAFYGTQTQCNTMKGNKQTSTVNGNPVITYTLCYGLSSNTNNSHCKKKECTDNSTIGLTDNQCNSFLSGCITNLVGCTGKETHCSLFNGTSDTCSKFIGNNKKCTRMSDCSSRQCSDFTNPTSQDDCYNYHSKCRFKDNTSSCIKENSCQNYLAIGNDQAEKYSYCRTVKDTNQLFCSFNNGDTNCSDYTCDSITISSDCLAYKYFYNLNVRKCYYINNQCVSTDDCTNIIIDYTSSLKPTTDSDKFTWCNNYYDKNNNQCSYHNSLSTTKCSNFIICEQIQTASSSIDCNIKFSSDPLSKNKACQYSNGKCYSVKKLCTDYVAIGSNNSQKTSFCQSMKLNTSLGDILQTSVISCIYQTGQTNCSAKTCENITSAINQIDCDAQALNCVYFGGLCFTKQTSCNSYSTVSISSSAALFCSSMLDSTGQHCGFIDGMNYCINSSTDCKGYRWVAYGGNSAPSPAPFTDSAKRQYCQLRRTTTGKLCGYNYGSSYCTIEINYCELITSPSSQLSCNLQASGCTYIQSTQKCEVTSRIISCNDITFNLSDDDSKLSYCQGIQNYKGYCTWISSTGYCDDLPSSCISISISSLSTDTEKQNFCLNRQSTSENCGWRIGDTITTCRSFNCFDIQNAQSQTFCDSIMSGCTYYNQQCISTQSSCKQYYSFGQNDEQKFYFCSGLTQSTSSLSCTYIKGLSVCSTRQSSCSTYSVSTLSDADKLIWCYLLKDTNENWCSFQAGDTACKQITCELIINPTSQKSCDFYLSGCQYYLGTCYTQPSSCSSYIIPSTITNKVEFCTNIKNTLSQYCNYVSGANCAVQSPDCSSITAIGSTTLNKQQYCQSRKTSDGLICTYSTSYTYCIRADTSTSCTLITGTIDSQQYCQKYSTNCAYLDQNQTCQLTSVLNTCQSYIFRSSLDQNSRLQYCTSVLQNTCTYIYGQTQCDNAYSFCHNWDLTYVDDKKSYCQARNSLQGNCSYDESNNSTCVLIKCQDVSSPTSQKDCDFQLLGCQYYRSSCIQSQNNCNLYKTYGSTDEVKLNYCLGLSTSDNTSCIYISGSDYCQNLQLNCSSYDVSLFISQADKELQCQVLIQQDGQSCINKNNSITCSLQQYTCESIADPLNQNDCDKLLIGKCLYYDSQCLTIQSSCTSIIIPSNIVDKYLFCKNMKDTSNNFCKYTENQPTCDLPTVYCNDIAAVGNTLQDQKNYCRQYKTQDGQMCGYSAGTQCEIETYYCNIFTGVTSQEYCDERMNNCIYISSTSKCIEKYEILQCQDILFNVGLSNVNKIVYCKQYIINNNQCTWINSVNYCQINNEQCIDYDASSQSDKRTFCLNKISSKFQCSWRDGDTVNNCRDFQCQDIDNPQSQNDCDKIQVGCTFYINTCFTQQDDCTKYFALYNDINQKQQFCNGISTTSNLNCTYLRNDYTCKNRDLCTNYNVSSIIDKFNTCINMYDLNGNQCIYYQGNSCDMVSNCESYTGFDLNNCPTLFDNNQRYCLISTNSCRTFVCEDISNPTNQSSCDAQLLNLCQFTNNLCITISTCDTYLKINWPSNADPIVYCSSLIDIQGHYCTAVDSTSIKCRQRECSDKQFYLNSECYSWKTSCKSDGAKCIESSQSCQNYTGNSDSCNKYLDSDNKNYCRVISGSDQQFGPCLELSCYQNTTATSDSECQQYQNGCLTKGNGCIPNTSTCDEYHGTRSQCMNFNGYLYSSNDIVVSEICSGDYTNTDTSKCRSRICSDNLTDVSDVLCQNFKKGCVTNGQGCIDINESCSSYKGTQNQCSQFKGNSQTIYCWNIDNATSSTYCIDKQCNYVKGKSDYECEQEFPKILINGQLILKCVSDGKQCINNPAKCNDFKGDDSLCGTFTASIDGPCKANSNGYCTPRLCYEAPSTYDTDDLCQQYHPSCLTTGNGCMKYNHTGIDNLPTLYCSDILTADICSLKIGCSLVNQCLQQAQQCSQLTSKGQAVCVNTVLTNGKRCIFDFSINKCRDFQCNDVELVTSHSICQQFSNDCTTNGNGCIIMQSCSKYLNSLTCQSAYSTETINRCTWENNSCRQRKCSDFLGTTDSSCKQFYSGCISNGINCIGPQYECKDLKQKNCLTDYFGNPCTYFQQNCYKYEKCQDLPFTTHLMCSQFLNLCTSNTQNCIPITKCQKYSVQESCKVGIDGQCGWINNACNKFTQCEDVQGINTQICQNYNPNCISDGVKCVSINYCNNYQSQYLCEQNNGLDGQCFWESTICRLKVCEDLITNIDTYEKCKDQLLPTQCTSNGIKCISLKECSSYDEKSCIIGIDGECIFQLPIGQKTGQKQCRLKVCEDIKGATLSVCQSILPNIPCVSNGTICITKSKCNLYTTKMACDSGGLDGLCAFTPYSSISNSGVCTIMTQCSDANNDKEACYAYSKYCQWTQSASIKQCIPHSCSTYNTGKDCLPIPSLDQTKFTLCAKINNLCQEVSTTQLNQDNCYLNSAKTFIWNNSQQKCIQCKDKTLNTNPSNTTTKFTQRIIFTVLFVIFI